MPAKRKESIVEQYLIDRTKETRGFTRKFKWPGRRGGPDRWCGWPHLKLYIIFELKSDEQDWGLQDYQAREIDLLMRCGMRVHVAENKDQIDAIFRHYGIVKTQ